jgi:hypothetical protein
MPKILSVLAVTALLSSCSVGMAISGKNNPDLGAVAIGKTRNEIEMHLGSPIKVGDVSSGKRTDLYEYQIGNEPSAGRAVGHAVMDVLTFGVWEIIGTPVEGFMGDKYNALITYDKNDKVIDVKTRKVSENK